MDFQSTRERDQAASGITSASSCVSSLHIPAVIHVLPTATTLNIFVSKVNVLSSSTLIWIILLSGSEVDVVENPRSLDISLSVTDPEFLVVQDSNRHDSNAIVLKFCAVLSYKLIPKGLRLPEPPHGPGGVSAGSSFVPFICYHGLRPNY